MASFVSGVTSPRVTRSYPALEGEPKSRWALPGPARAARQDPDGVARRTVDLMVAEIATDSSVFPTA